MMKYKLRNYYCPVCEYKEQHKTNHVEEIYCTCKRCGNSILYCEDAPEKIPEKTCVLKSYFFDLNNPKESKEYFELVKKLKNEYHYELFDSVTTAKTLNAIKSHNGETIELYDVNQFKNQIVSNIGRVFYWYEGIVLGVKNKKSGYYLVFE